MDVEDLTSTVDRIAARFGPTVLRWTAAMLWLGNIAWKRPPDFGRSADACSGLCRYVADGAEHPVFPGSAWLFEHLIGPNLGVFGWFTVLAEGIVAALLLSGRFRRLAAVGGIMLSIGIMAAVANAPGEWYWTYILMIALHVGVLVTTPASPEQAASTTAMAVMGFGASMLVVHIGSGVTGTAFTIFDGRAPLPNDLARNLWGGSALLGLALVLVGGLGFWVAKGTDPGRARIVGWAAMAAALVMFATYGSDGTVLGLGSTTSSACVLLALGLGLAFPPAPQNRSGPR
jgi:hypothetical protein